MSGQPARFAVIGGGWRSGFYLRLARDLPHLFEVTGIYSRSADKREAAARQHGVRALGSVDEVVRVGEPEFVVIAVPWLAAPEVTMDVTGRGLAVLEETPPAPDLKAMRELWDRVGTSELVQVADQSLYMPSHQARLQMISDDVIGTPTSVHVSSNHQYHAVAIMRGMLGVGFERTKVNAQEFHAPTVDPVGLAGFTGDPTPASRATTLATIDFGDGRSGLYDFTVNQWFNPLRQRRLLIRGTHGEIVDDKVVFMEDPTTVVESRILRRQLGVDLNLEGYGLDNISFNGRAVYRNPFRGAPQTDEDIAVADIVRRMTRWVRGAGAPPYPLAGGLQDHLIGLAMEESLATGNGVITEREPWAAAATWSYTSY